MRGDYYRIAQKMDEEREAYCQVWRDLRDMGAEDLITLDFIERINEWMKARQERVFDRIQAHSSELAARVRPAEVKHCWHLTIRPRPNACSFDEFRKLVDKLAKSRCFTDVVYVFEQKGTSAETMGTGFHSHMVVRTSDNRTKTHLRTAASKLLNVCGEAGLQIERASRPAQLIEKYLMAHESLDGHKEETMEMDCIWRTTMGLEPIYGSPEVFRPPPTKSEEGGVYRVFLH